jgi:hypothetical protein
VTALMWLLSVIVVPLLLAEFTDVSPWLAEKLVRRAARRLPEPERSRWQEEWAAELGSKPGRLWRLVWALSLLAGAGKMGRMLGAPSTFETLRARMRAVWQRLRLRSKAPATGSESAPVVQAEPQPATLAVDAQTVTKVVLADAGSATDTLAVTAWQFPKPVASDRDFERWLRRKKAETDLWFAEVAQEQKQFEESLALQRREFEGYLDRMTSAQDSA